MTLKCDVYSFGVILLETLSGERNGALQRLLAHAWELWEQNRIVEFLDTTMVPLAEFEQELLCELKRCIQIGLLCVQETPSDRPTMSAIVAMLTSTTSKIDWPRRQMDSDRVVSSSSSHGVVTGLLSHTTTDLT